ncbi:MAG: sensor histidine kinase N-terminal domain-containing protein [Alsobacter sp.]
MAPSIRLQMVAWVLGPLTAFFALSTWSSYRDAAQTAELVADTALLGSARSIAERIEQNDGVVEAVIPPSALERIATGQHDRVVYKVFWPGGDLLAGYPDVPEPPRRNPGLDPVWYDATFRGQAIRAVAIGQPVAGRADGFAVVIVGETRMGQDDLARGLWHGTLGRDGLMVLLTGLMVLVGLRQGLRPILRIRNEVRARPAGSLDRLERQQVQSEFRPLVDALNASIDTVERQVQRRYGLIADAAHQLRTPLAVLITQAEVGLRASRPGRKQEALDAVKATAAEMGRLTDQLLILARVENVAVATPLVRVDLRDVVRRVVTSQAARALDEQVTLAFDEPSTPVTVTGDAALLGEMVSNLLDNAIRHGGPRQEVTLGISASDAVVRLEVADEGPGIPWEHRKTVFDRFFRIDGTAAEGSGLGLAIVAEIVKAHGGTVGIADGRAGRGIVVQVALPEAEPA